MELEEALALIKTQNASIVSLGGEKDSMKSKMDQLLTETKTAKNDKRDFETKFATLTTEFEEFRTNSSLDEDTKKKLNELVSQKVEKQQTKFDEQVAEMQSSLSDAQGKYGDLKSRYDNERIGGALRKAAESAGVIPSAIDDVVSRAFGIFSISEEGTLESRDSDGNLKKIGKKIASPDVFVESLKDSASHLWPVSKGSGANGSSGGSNDGVNPFAKDTLNYTEQARLVRADPAKAERMRAAAK